MLASLFFLIPHQTHSMQCTKSNRMRSSPAKNSWCVVVTLTRQRIHCVFAGQFVSTKNEDRVVWLSGSLQFQSILRNFVRKSSKNHIIFLWGKLFISAKWWSSRALAEPPPPPKFRILPICNAKHYKMQCIAFDVIGWCLLQFRHSEPSVAWKHRSKNTLWQKP